MSIANRCCIEIYSLDFLQQEEIITHIKITDKEAF